MPRYMIHACPERMWYVEGFLVPSMLAQGIREGEILVRCDTERRGNLWACAERLREAGTMPGGTWHIQDDVLICRDFAERTREEDHGIAWGFACHNFGDSPDYAGEVPAVFAWHSFQCLRLPNELAAEWVVWLEREAPNTPTYEEKIRTGKCDDELLRFFLRDKHGDMRVRNLTPCLVEHVDWLIGGTVLNPHRRLKLNRAMFWEDEALVEELKEAVEHRT